MKRNIEQYLLDWKNKEHNLPLLLLGARQIGKTYSLKKFARSEFSSFIYINFEEKPNLVSLFDSDLTPKRIVEEIELLFEQPIDPLEDLIIFDEVQLAPKCITSLKYFAESEIDYNICCAGSLLGVMLHHENLSFPVGKVEFKKMYQLSFDEFLYALHLDNLVDRIRTCFTVNEPMPDELHNKLLGLYKDYLCIGGMPQSVLEYMRSDRDIIQYDRSVLNNIINAYIADTSKYTSASESIKVQAIFKTLHEQLARENKKFKYSTVKKGSKASYFESSIEWLIASNIHLISKAINTPRLPISAYVIDNTFKLFMNDVGLLNELAKIPFKILYSDDDNIYKGAVTENYVASELMSRGYDLYYYKDNSMEIDFLIQCDEDIVPIEVKARKSKRARSFNKYVKMYKPSRAIKISQANFGMVDNVKTIPLYSVFLV